MDKEIWAKESYEDMVEKNSVVSRIAKLVAVNCPPILGLDAALPDQWS